MRVPIASAIVTGLAAAPAIAADLTVTVEIPRLNVAEYHRPYVAIWLEAAGAGSVTNLAIWYDLKLKNNEGTKWLKDLRQWWRRSGRDLAMPVDGLSGATRPPGAHQLAVSGATAPLDKLPPGNYHLVVEAAREVGGRELLRIPLQWPPRAPQAVQVKGEHELDGIKLELKP